MNEQWEGTKLQLEYKLAGSEKLGKQTFNGISQDATKEDMGAFANAVARLAKGTDASLNGVIAITSTRLTPADA